MTAQYSDIVYYKQKKYELAGTTSDGLFNPMSLGLKPIPCCTACWNGFLIEYRVAYKKFQVKNLLINLNDYTENKKIVPEPITINGIQPEAKDADGMFDTIYQKIHLTIPYTGKILIARNFIRWLYVHMGYHSAWKYKDVVELQFQEGRLNQEEDLSGQLSNLRIKYGLGSKPNCHDDELEDEISERMKSLDKAFYGDRA